MATLREGRWLELQRETFQNTKQSLARVLRIMLVVFTAVLWSSHLIKVKIHIVWVFQLNSVYVLCTDLYVYLLVCFFMCMGVCPACMSLITCMPGAHRGQERLLDTLRLELQTVVSCYVGGGTQSWVLWKNSQCS